MFHPSLINVATGFPFAFHPAGPEALTPRSPFTRDGIFLYQPSSPSCSSGGIPSPRVISPCANRKSSFTIDAILGLKSKVEEVTPIAREASSPTKSLTDVLSQPPSSQANSLKRKLSPSCKIKAKRIRTIFTPDQIDTLETVFSRQQYMVGPERLALAHSLGLSEAQVKVWFQNRRIKWRKAHLEQHQLRMVSSGKHSENDDLDEISDERGLCEAETKEFEYSDE